MALDLIKQLLIGEKDYKIDGTVVIDKATGKSVSEHINDSSIHLTEAAVKTITDPIETELTSLKGTVETFLGGEPDDNEKLDRLTELVGAIEENKDSIDKLLNSGTSVALVTSADATPVFDSKLVLVVEAYEAEAE